MSGVDYYELFSLAPSAGADELRKRYRALSLQFHPDRGGSTEQMARLNEAYRVLSTPNLKHEYDQRRMHTDNGIDDIYRYTQPRRRPAPYEPPSDRRSFWRWFIVLVLMGITLVTYSVMTLVVMPSFVREDALTTTLPGSGETLAEEAATALSDVQAQTGNLSAEAQSQVRPAGAGSITTETTPTQPPERSWQRGRNE